MADIKVSELAPEIKLRNELGEDGGFVGKSVDELTSENEKALELAFKDDVTGLLTRGAFMDEARTYISRAERNGESFVTLMLDINDFKKFNDTFGHKTGDAVLGLVADGLRSVSRESDILGKYGGDELVAVLTGYKSKSKDVAIAWRIQNEIEQYISEHNQISGIPDIKVSVGVAYSDENGFLDLPKSLDKADKMMYQEKARRKQNV